MQNPKAYIWTFIGRFIPQVIYLLTTIVLAHFLSPEDFGTIGVLAIFFTIANTLMDAGLGGSLIKEKTITALDCSSIFVFNLTISHAIYFVLFIFSYSIESFFGIEGLADIIKILCLVFIINSWGLVARTLLIRNLELPTYLRQ